MVRFHKDWLRMSPSCYYKKSSHTFYNDILPVLQRAQKCSVDRQLYQHLRPFSPRKPHRSFRNRLRWLEKIKVGMADVRSRCYSGCAIPNCCVWLTRNIGWRDTALHRLLKTIDLILISSLAHAAAFSGGKRGVWSRDLAGDTAPAVPPLARRRRR